MKDFIKKKSLYSSDRCVHNFLHFSKISQPGLSQAIDVIELAQAMTSTKTNVKMNRVINVKRLLYVFIWSILLTAIAKYCLTLSTLQPKNISKMFQIKVDAESNRLAFRHDKQRKTSLTGGQNAFLKKSEITSELREVPTGTSRFDYPWRIPTLVRPLPPSDSNNRFLYSPLKDAYINGLGHNLGTINGEVSTAIRLNLTYTHRISWYSLHSIPFQSISDKYKSADLNAFRPFLHAGSVEQLFGWGVSEIPREHIQSAICPFSVLSGKNGLCRVCTKKGFKQRRQEMLNNGSSKQLQYTKNSIKVDHVVELPYNLTFGFPKNPSEMNLQYASSFMETHAHPNTIFTLPAHRCDKNPVFGSFSRAQKAYFFHKYWGSHNSSAVSIDNKANENETFNEYKGRATSTFVIGPVGRRPTLTRLKIDSIIIAVHARRGDFFRAKRPMVSLSFIVRTVREIMKRVVQPAGGLFADLGVSVNIYSEGAPLNSSEIDHDVTKQGNQFVDVNRKLFSEQDIRTAFLDDKSDIFNGVFKNSLEVNARISDNTMLSIHEMIAADIFIGSESSLSSNLVGSLSRAAFIIIPGTEDLGQSDMDVDERPFIRPKYNATRLSASDLRTMLERWIMFQKYNEDSVKRATF